MADLSKLKRKALGAPPALDEASPNLSAPEVAPAPSVLPPVAPHQPINEATPTSAATLVAVSEPPAKRRDGRSARRTNRTLPFATRISPEFDNRLRDIAERDNLLLVEVLERAVEAYEKATQAKA